MVVFMRGFLTNLSYRFREFMIGRYGDDALNRFLTGAGTACLILSMFPRLTYAYLGMMICFGWSLFRMFSKNAIKRNRENAAYLKISDGIKNKCLLIKGMFRDRKTHEYFKCPNCKTYVRIIKPPKGKNIAIRCSKCRSEFTRRT